MGCAVLLMAARGMLMVLDPAGSRHAAWLMRARLQPKPVPQEHLGGLASWTPPAAGMFLWLRLHGVACADAILERLQAEKVVVVPGANLGPTPTLPNHLRP